jgi:two-component system chemotaxis response regulator CheB
MSAHPYEAIVIGTSAGGLRALTSLLENIPPGYGIPLIIVQHRAKDSRDLFEDILQGRCNIPVKQADEKEMIRKGIAYTAPPDYHLLVEMDKTFSLSADAPVKFSRPSIDVLFDSAALAYRDKLVGIILTGANDDGADGITSIRRNGGLTIAQDPLEAQFTPMPQASIETGDVMHVWTLREIRDFMLAL